MQEFHEALSVFINAQVKVNRDAIERMCEIMLTSNTHGVRVIYERNGTVTAELHPSVPYGELHEYPQGIREDLR